MPKFFILLSCICGCGVGISRKPGVRLLYKYKTSLFSSKKSPKEARVLCFYFRFVSIGVGPFCNLYQVSGWSSYIFPVTRSKKPEDLKERVERD